MKVLSEYYSHQEEIYIPISMRRSKPVKIQKTKTLIPISNPYSTKIRRKRNE